MVTGLAFGFLTKHLTKSLENYERFQQEQKGNFADIFGEKLNVTTVLAVENKSPN